MNKKKYSSIADHIISYIVMAIIVIHPIFMRYYEYNSGLSEYPWMSNETSSIDLFLHCKMTFFTLCCVLLLIVFFFKIYHAQTDFSIPKTFWLLFAYVMFTLLSTFLSKYNQFSFSGIHEQFESIWCLLGYILVLMVLYSLISGSEQLELFLKAFIIGAAIVGMIGVSQFVGFDILMSNLAGKLILPMGFNGHLQLSFSRGMVYATFYNPDYVGLYASLIVPILMSAVQVMNRKIWKALALIDVVMMLICVIGATAASGIIAMWMAIIIYITLHIISIRHKKTKVLLSIGALILLIGLSVGIAYTSTYLREHILVENTSIDTDQQPTSDTDLDSDQALAAEIPADHSTLLNSIIETDKYVEFNYNGYLLRENIYIENGVALINFVDEKGNQIKYTYDATSGIYSIEDPRFNTITSVTCSIDDQFIGFVTTIDGKEWTFAYGMGSEGNVTYYYYTDWSKMDKSIASESLFIPESKWGILNGRGFLWAKTLGLLKHHLILGTGADSFTLAFPHSDYVAMYKSGYEDMIVTKPHNLYLQCATQSGVLALLCLLLFYVLFFIRNGKRMLANQATNSSVSLVRNAFFAGTIGFLVCGLANDSTICVTPIFCIVMGLALGLEKIDVANKQ